MAIGRYAKDYTTEYVTDKKGRVRKVGRYTGPEYSYVEDEDGLRLGRIGLGAGIAFSLLFNLAVLIIPAQIMHKWYTSAPMIMCLLGNVHLILAYVGFLIYKEPLTREQMEHTYERLAIWSFLDMVFSVISLTGQIIRAVRSAAQVRDYVIMSLTAGLIISSACVFKMKKSARSVERSF